MAAAAVGCLVVRELSSQAFSLTLAQLKEALAFMGRSPDYVTKWAQAQLEEVVPSARLHIIQCGLADFEWARAESKMVDALCERLAELAQEIHANIGRIHRAVDDFNQLYFRSWRTLSVERELAAIRAAVKLLQETYDEFKSMLPSCLANIAARRRAKPPASGPVADPAPPPLLATETALVPCSPLPAAAETGLVPCGALAVPCPVALGGQAQ
jgi:hypothetical protein